MELATMTVEGGGNAGSRLLHAMRARVRAIGGDAVVGLRQGIKPRQPGTDVLESMLSSEATTLSGTIIRFADPTCME